MSKNKTNTVVHNNTIQLKPKNEAQSDFIRSIAENELTIAIGPAGTGKTFLSVAMAYQYLIRSDSKINKIIITRPTVETSGLPGKKFGSLPGDVDEKMGPFMRPIFDELLHFVKKQSEIDLMIKEGVLEVSPLEFTRGRNYHNTFVILDEAQNCVPSELDMLTTRLGRNSKMVISGDITQTDLPKGFRGGLEDYYYSLKNMIVGVGTVEFHESDVVRNTLMVQVINCVKNYRFEKENYNDSISRDKNFSS